MLSFYLSILDSEQDQSKLERLYLSYKQTMFYVANRILKDNYLAEDAVHQAFLRIINNLNKIDVIECPKTRGFVVIIVQNTAIDLYNRRKHQNTIPLHEITFQACDASDSILSGEYNELEKKIISLPVQYSSVILLRYSQGYSVAEIADILGISQDNVRKRIERGKKKLAQMLDEEVFPIG